jgi:hypothetical protein
MPTPIYHIPTELKPGKSNNQSKALFFVPCAICGQKYEVREGLWLPMFSSKGTQVEIKVCGKCYVEETQ